MGKLKNVKRGLFAIGIALFILVSLSGIALADTVKLYHNYGGNLVEDESNLFDIDTTTDGATTDMSSWVIEKDGYKFKNIVISDGAGGAKKITSTTFVYNYSDLWSALFGVVINYEKETITQPNTGGSNSNCLVIFFLDGVEIERQIVAKGTVVSAPTSSTNPNMVNPGYTVDGWYKVDSNKTKWDFTKAVMNNLKLEGTWVTGDGESTEELDPNKKYYEVRFFIGDKEITRKIVEEGTKVTAPTASTNSYLEGYTINGWDVEPNQKWNFNDPVNSDLNLTGDVEETEEGGDSEEGGYPDWLWLLILAGIIVIAAGVYILRNKIWVKKE